jgi:hypothetical protein
VWKLRERIDHHSLQLLAGEYNVRFIVRDALGNRIGSVAAPVKVTA